MSSFTDKTLQCVECGSDFTYAASEQELHRYPFLNIAELTRQADLFWINLEGTLTRTTTPVPKNFNFRAEPEDVAILQEAGIDVVSLANNHAFDFGSAGLVETLSTLEAAGIAAHGAGLDLASARRPALLRRNGISVGFLGYVYLGPGSIEPPSIYATRHPTRSNVCSSRRVARCACSRWRPSGGDRSRRYRNSCARAQSSRRVTRSQASTRCSERSKRASRSSHTWAMRATGRAAPSMRSKAFAAASPDSSGRF